MWSPSQEGVEILEARGLCSRRSPSAHHARQRCYGTIPQINPSLARLCRCLTTSSTDQSQSMRCLRDRSPYSRGRIHCKGTFGSDEMLLYSSCCLHTRRTFLCSQTSVPRIRGH